MNHGRCIEHHHYTPAGISAAVQDIVKFNGFNVTILVQANFHLHVARMPAFIGSEYLAAFIGDFNRPANLPGEQGSAKISGTGFSLAAETTADSRYAYPDLAHRHLQNNRELAVQVMGHLGARPQAELTALGIVAGQGCMGLQKSVVDVRSMEFSFQYVSRLCKSLVRITEQLLTYVQNIIRGIFVDTHFTGAFHGFKGVQQHRQGLIFHLDQVKGFLRCFFVNSGNSGHSFSPEADFVHSQGRLIGRLGNDTPFVRSFISGNYRQNSRQLKSLAVINFFNKSMGVRAAFDLTVSHPRQHHIACINRLTFNLRRGIFTRHASSYLGKIFIHYFTPS